MAEFSFTDLLPLGHDDTTYRKIADGGVEATRRWAETSLDVDPEALTLLSRTAFRDIAHLLRPSHLRQLRAILDDPEASPNDRYVARDLLQNANIAAGGRPADVPGHRDRDRDGQARPAGAHRRT